MTLPLPPFYSNSLFTPFLLALLVVGSLKVFHGCDKGSNNSAAMGGAQWSF